MDFESQNIKKFSSLFLPISRRISFLFPYLDMNLEYARIDAKPEEYTAFVIQISLIVSLNIFGFLALLAQKMNRLTMQWAVPMAGLSVCSFFFLLWQFIILYPKVKSKKITSEVEMYLPFAMRQLYVRVNSGLSLFNSLVGVAYEDYGQFSIELKRTVSKIQSGIPEVEALEELSREVPSPELKRVIWQITNSLRSGTDVSETLHAIIEDINEKQKAKIMDFGSKMTAVSMMYMIMTIIFPTMGYIVLLLLGSFFIQNLQDYYLFAIPAVVLFANIVFLNIIDAMRPRVEI